MKLIYRRCGDYYLPNIGIPAEDIINFSAPDSFLSCGA